MNTKNMHDFSDFIEMIKHSINNDNFKTYIAYKTIVFNNEYQLQFFYNGSSGIDVLITNFSKSNLHKNIDKMAFDSYLINTFLKVFQNELQEYKKVKLYKNLKDNLKTNNKVEKLVKV